MEVLKWERTQLFSKCAEVMGLEPFPSWLGALSSHVSEIKLLPAINCISLSAFVTLAQYSHLANNST